MAKFFTKEDDAVIREAWVAQKPDQNYGTIGAFDEAMAQRLGRSKEVCGYRRTRLGMNKWTKRARGIRKYTKSAAWKASREARKTVKAEKVEVEPTITEPKACYCRFCGMKI